MTDVSATSVSLVTVPGLAWANHDICSWSFVPEPATLLLVCGAAAAVALKRSGAVPAGGRAGRPTGSRMKNGRKCR